MVRLRSAFAAVAVVGLIACGSASAQTKPAPSSQTKAAPAAHSKSATAGQPTAATAKPSEPAKRSDGILSVARKKWDGISTMTRREWNAAKGTWAREQVKWADCRQQSRTQKLKAPKSWTFIGKCMTH